LKSRRQEKSSQEKAIEEKREGNRGDASGETDLRKSTETIKKRFDKYALLLVRINSGVLAGKVIGNVH